MLIVGFGIGIMITYVNTPVGVALQRYVPKDKLGRVNSIINLMAIGVIPFSTALAGVLIENLPLPFFYGIVALGMIVSTRIAYRSNSNKTIFYSSHNKFSILLQSFKILDNLRNHHDK